MSNYRQVMNNLSKEEWNQIVSRLPGAHVLQSYQWGQVKTQYGWSTERRVWKNFQDEVVAAAQILRRDVAHLGMSVLYIPKGPLLRNWNDLELRNQVLGDLEKIAHESKAIFIKIDPDICIGMGIPGEADFREDSEGKKIVEELEVRNWQFSDEQIQFRNTVLIDLNASEDEILARMKQKTRYNIRLAGRRGVVLRIANDADIDLLYRMYAQTSLRDGFVIREKGYYRMVWEIFFDHGLAEGLIAEVNGDPVAGAIIFRFGNRAWYLYGMSFEEHREKMPSYLIQWEAMRRAKQAGCLVYDMWGAPDRFNQDDPLWGVFRFKTGFGGRVELGIGAWDYPSNSWLYRLYTNFLPRVMDFLRRRGRIQTQQSVST